MVSQGDVQLLIFQLQMLGGAALGKPKLICTQLEIN